MQQQSATFKILGNCQLPLFHLSPLVVEQCEIIDLPQIAFRTQHLFAIVIKSVEVYVGKELTGQIADRNAASSFQGRKHFIAREMNVDRFLRIGSVNNAVHQIQGSGACDASTNVLFENFVNNRGEISINATAKHITKSIPKLLISCHRAVRALALAICTGIKNESALEYLTQNGMQRMVNDPVSKRRCGNDSMLGSNTSILL